VYSVPQIEDSGYNLVLFYYHWHGQPELMMLGSAGLSNMLIFMDVHLTILIISDIN